MKKEYKVEALTFQVKGFSMSNLKTQQIEIQEQLDLYASKGYRLVSTTSTGDVTTSIFIYLFFEKDV
jgi:hypothetical protein